MTQRRKEAASVELDLLDLVKPTCTGKECLEPIGVLHRPGVPALRDLEQGSRSERRAEPQMEELLEPTPARRAFILLELDVPQLGHVFEVVRGHPDLFRHGSLLVKVGLTSIDEDQWVAFAVEARKVHLL